MSSWDIYTWDFPYAGAHLAAILGTDEPVKSKGRDPRHSSPGTRRLVKVSSGSYENSVTYFATPGCSGGLDRSDFPECKCKTLFLDRLANLWYRVR